MSLSYDELVHEFGRLNAVGAPKTKAEHEERTAFAAECFRLFSWCTYEQFKQVVNLVVERHKKGTYTIQEFRAAIQSLRERGAIKSDSCRSCGGVRWVYCELAFEDGHRETAVRHCSVCRPGIHWEQPKNTILYPQEKSFAVQMADLMTPQIAYRVIESGAKMNIRFDTDALAIMSEKAAQYKAEIEEARKESVFSKALGIPDRDEDVPFV